MGLACSSQIATVVVHKSCYLSREGVKTNRIGVYSLHIISYERLHFIQAKKGAI
jgi:hypothetical protein